MLPAQLVFEGQGLYLQAYDLERAGYCIFRLSRILPPGANGGNLLPPPRAAGYQLPQRHPALVLGGRQVALRALHGLPSIR